jgi:hypothetical protein
MPNQMDASAALSWDSYAEKTTRSFNALLGKDPLPEVAVQRFLEQHPAVVPFPQGFVGAGGLRGAHGALHSAVFTQPPLPGIERPVPDFMRIVRDSGAIYPVLIEIEAPNRRVTNRNGDLTAGFTHALGQLRAWSAWFDDPANQIQFRSLYRIPEEWGHRPLRPKYLLVYGRRAELEHKPKAIAQREQLLASDAAVMSFDRLAPSPLGRMEVTVRLAGRDFKAVALSPTLQVGPQNAEALSTIDGKVAAAKRTAMLTPERRHFLAERLPYWDGWIASTSRPRILAPTWE